MKNNSSLTVRLSDIAKTLHGTDAKSESIAMTAEEQLEFWTELTPPNPTQSQQLLGSIMRGQQ